MFQRLRPLAIFLVLGSLLGLRPALADFTAVQMGNFQLGEGYNFSCNGDVVAGFQFMVGSAMDKLTPFCTPIHAGGTTDYPPRLHSELSVGGEGGDAGITLRCPQNYAVAKLGLSQDNGNGGFNNKVMLLCRNLQNGTEKKIGRDFDCEDGDPDCDRTVPNDAGVTYLDCGPTRLLTGLKGSAGNIVFAIAIKCSNNPFVEDTTPVPTPHPSDPGGWTAFAIGSDGYWGYNNKPEDEPSARQHAVNGCGGPAHNCKDFWATTDSCVAFAMSPAPEFFYAAGSGTSKNTAQSNALKFCQSGNAPAGVCEVLMSRCN